MNKKSGELSAPLVIRGIAKRPTRPKKENKCPTESLYQITAVTAMKSYDETEKRLNFLFSLVLKFWRISYQRKKAARFSCNQQDFSPADVVANIDTFLIIKKYPGIYSHFMYKFQFLL